MSWPSVLLICDFYIYSLVGRARPPTLWYFMGHWRMVLKSLKVCQIDSILKCLQSNFFHVFKGKYYLADAGHGISRKLLTPYCGTWYHLKEFGVGRLAPQNPKELFNHQHSSLRNAIERLFGVLKKKFPCLLVPRQQPIKTQVNLVIALAAIHNYALSLMGPEWIEEGENNCQEEGMINDSDANMDTIVDSNLDDRKVGSKMCDCIAQKMWADHIKNRRAWYILVIWYKSFFSFFFFWLLVGSSCLF